MAEESLLPADDADTSGQPDTGVQPDGTGEVLPWQWSDDLPGSGDAPDWLKADKYGSVAEQAKAYGELESKFGAFTGAPEEYEVPGAEHYVDSIDLPEGVEFDINKDDPLLQAFIPAAKEMGINQDGFNKLVGLYIQQQVNDYSETMSTAEEQKAMLGDNADERLNNIARWARANMDEELFGKLTESLTTASAVEAVEHLIGKTRNAPLPNAGEVNPAPAYSKEDYDIEMGKKGPNGELLFVTDPEHRRKVERMGQQIFGTEPQRQIMG